MKAIVALMLMLVFVACSRKEPLLMGFFENSQVKFTVNDVPVATNDVSIWEVGDQKKSRAAHLRLDVVYGFNVVYKGEDINGKLIIKEYNKTIIGEDRKPKEVGVFILY